MAKEPNWTNEEIEKFKLLYPKTNQDELVKIFGRSIGALQTFAHKHNIKKEINKSGKKIFLNDEIQKIISLSKDMSVPEISRKIGRSKESIYELLARMNIDNPISAFWWTENEIELLKEHYINKTPDELEKLLNKSWGAIKRRAQKMKLLRKKKNGEFYKAQKPITEKEKIFILNNYTKMGVNEMAKELGRSSILVETFCDKNKLNILKLRNNPKNFSDEFLLNKLVEMEKILQRCPTSEDIQKDRNLPSVDIYYDRFETFSNACELAGLIPNIGRYGTLCYSKNGDRCLSIREQTITNFFIDNNIKYKKEKLYNSIIQNLKESIRMDWFLVEYDVIVEYFGLNNKIYNEKTKKKLDICKENKLKIISLFEKDIDKLEKVFNDFIK